MIINDELEAIESVGEGKSENGGEGEQEAEKILKPEKTTNNT